MSTRTIGRVVGALFLLAFVVYIAGGALVDSASGTADVLPGVVRHETRVAAGALLMLANSFAVVGIGVLMVPVLRPHHELSAYAYLVGRAIEAILLTVGIVFLLLLVPLAEQYAGDGAGALPALARVVKEGNRYCFQLGMITLGLGGLVLCHVMLRARLVPGFIAVWGLVGYAVFLLGAILEVLGYRVGVILSVPGGLFEVGLGVLLLAKGFPAGRTRDRAGAAHTRPPAVGYQVAVRQPG
jgi:hypothetical protein